MVKNTKNIEQLSSLKPYVAPVIEIDTYHVEKGFAYSQAWDQETVSLLTDDDGNVDQEGGGWFEEGGVVF